MAKLINGNGSEGITAQVDADFWSGLTGGVTGIMPAGERMAATIVDNQPRIADGVLLTKEGRRVQIDSGDVDDFTIPAGVDGVTAYYIIGYKLVTAANELQTVESFVQQSTADGAIEEGMIRDGDTEVYISLYRIIQTGTVNAVGDCLLPVFSPLGSTADSGGDDSGGGESGGESEGESSEDALRRVMSGTKNGLKFKIVAYKKTKLVYVQIDGTTSSKISCKNSWYTIDYESGIRPLMELSGYAIINTLQMARWCWTSDGYLKIGYAKSVAGGGTQDIEKGYAVHMSFMFAADKVES
jgi:hypothetical protein